MNEQAPGTAYLYHDGQWLSQQTDHAELTRGVWAGRYKSVTPLDRAYVEVPYRSNIGPGPLNVPRSVCSNDPEYIAMIRLGTLTDDNPFIDWSLKSSDPFAPMDQAALQRQLKRMRNGDVGVFSGDVELTGYPPSISSRSTLAGTWDTTPSPTPIAQLTEIATNIQAAGRAFSRSYPPAEMVMNRATYTQLLEAEAAESEAEDEPPDAVELLKEKTRAAIRERLKEQRRSKRW